MKATGFVRKIDELGRIVLPKSLRDELQLEIRCAVEIFVEDNKIVLQKYQPGDMFTGELEDLVEYKGKKFSRDTIKDLVDLSKINKRK